MLTFNIVVSAIVTVLGLVLIIYSTVLTIENKDDFHTDPSSIYYDFAITIDAGSSHSAVFLYDWSSLKLRGTGLVEQLGPSCHVTPGISAYADNPSDAYSKIEKCLRDTLDLIPEAKRSAPIVVSVGATAGMRVLNLTRPDDTKAIFNDLEGSLVRLSNQLADRNLEVGQIGIISGTQEGSAAWITVNYLMKFLLPYNNQRHTVGIMDMGGASAQIAFELPASEPSDSKEHAHNGSIVERLRETVEDHEKPEATLKPDTHLKLYGRKYDLISFSNLCYGSDQILLRLSYGLILDAIESNSSIADEGMHVLTHPCLPVDVSIEYSQKDLKSACLERRGGGPRPRGHYKLLGKPSSSKAQRCSDLIADIIDPKTCAKDYTMCARALAAPPPKSAQFYGMSNYYFATRALPAVYTSKAKDTRISRQEFLDGTMDFCGLARSDIVQLITKYPSISPKIDYAQMMCFKLLAVYHTLTKLYHFDDQHFKQISYTADIKGAEIGWSLGFTLDLTNTLPGLDLTPPVGGISMILIMVLAAAMVILTLISCLINVYFEQKRKQYLTV